MIARSERSTEALVALTVVALVAYVFLLLAFPGTALAVPAAAIGALVLVTTAAAQPTRAAAALIFVAGAAGLSISTVGVELGVRVYALDGLLLLSLIGVALRVILRGDRSVRAPLLLPAALLLAFLTASAAHGILSGNDLRAVLGDYRRLAVYPTILLVLLAATRDWGDARALLGGLVAAGYATSGIELLRIARGVGYNEVALAGQTIRYLSYLEATTAALAVLVLVGYSRMQSGRTRVACLAAAAPLAATVLFSNYRTMWLALTAGLAIQSLSLGWRRGLRAIAIGAVVLVPTVYALVAWTPLGEYVLDRFDPLNAAASGMWRYFSWKAATDVWLSRPWLGTGLGYQHRFEYMNVESGNFVATTENTIHNDPLWYLVNNGVVGVAVLLTFAAPILRRALRLAESNEPRSRFCGSTAVGALGLMVIVSLLQPFFSIGATMILTALFVALILRSPFSSEHAS